MFSDKIDKYVEEMSVKSWLYYQQQIAHYTKKAKEAYAEIEAECKPKEIVIGKKYLCVKHAYDLMGYSKFSPIYYAKLLKDNKLCLYFNHAGFENKECVVRNVSLYRINDIHKCFSWIITIENESGERFQCLYSTRYSNLKYPDIDSDDLSVQLNSSSAAPIDVVNGVKIIIAMDYMGAVCTYKNTTPNDWVWIGTPIIPEGVNSWHQFMCHPESKMMDEQGNLLSIDDWLKACNSQKD